MLCVFIEQASYFIHLLNFINTFFFPCLSLVPEKTTQKEFIFTVFPVPTMQFRLAWNLCMSEDDLEPLDPPASTSNMLGLQAHNNTSSFILLFPSCPPRGFGQKRKHGLQNQTVILCLCDLEAERHSHIPPPLGHS